jgi:hypothetical protein
MERTLLHLDWAILCGRGVLFAADAAVGDSCADRIELFMKDRSRRTGETLIMTTISSLEQILRDVTRKFVNVASESSCKVHETGWKRVGC